MIWGKYLNLSRFLVPNQKKMEVIIVLNSQDVVNEIIPVKG